MLLIKKVFKEIGDSSAVDEKKKMFTCGVPFCDSFTLSDIVYAYGAVCTRG